MFTECKLRVIQTEPGRSLGADINQKWLEVKLRRDSLKSYTKENYLKEKTLYELIANGLASFAFGSYSIVNSHKGTVDSSWSIGTQGSPSKLKFWRYDPARQNIYFGTIRTDLGSDRRAPDEYTDEMVLFNTLLTNTRVVPSNGSAHSDGFVHIKSWIGPFREGTIYWES